ncbi:hypothetical protein BpHYR1_004213 [Brachionus plicatilis]|uniref:Uncharacterized protein n=1 Tax=Brachionus plicatilis TaxID=10195 RepID=A0A3M7Q6T5_BRAPC|nr:hypothetical protein BpHYR1_004213 [Brachionus plicatilis]
MKGSRKKLIKDSNFQSEINFRHFQRTNVNHHVRPYQCIVYNSDCITFLKTYKIQFDNIIERKTARLPSNKP